MKGLAKLFVQGERNLNTWEKLKRALKDEFGDKLNGAELYRQLDNKKIGKNESVQAYFLAMRELANRGEIGEEALFQYVIDGINDQLANKSILYGAKNMKEFKEKLKTYEKMRSSSNSISKSTSAATDKRKVGPSRKKDVEKETADRCFNCGGKGHMSRDCSKKNLGKRCFKCREFGHIAANCSKVVDANAVEAKVNWMSEVNKDEVPCARRIM